MLPSILETLEHLFLIQTRVTIDRLRHGSLHHSGQNRARGVNRNKRNRYKSLILATIKQEQLILAQGEDSKKGQLIYLMRKGSFQVNLYKMIRFLSEILKKHAKLAKIVKISEIFNRLVFPLSFNRFSHPMTHKFFMKIKKMQIYKVCNTTDRLNNKIN